MSLLLQHNTRKKKRSFPSLPATRVSTGPVACGDAVGGKAAVRSSTTTKRLRTKRLLKPSLPPSLPPPPAVPSSADDESDGISSDADFALTDLPSGFCEEVLAPPTAEAAPVSPTLRSSQPPPLERPPPPPPVQASAQKGSRKTNTKTSEQKEEGCLQCGGKHKTADCRGVKRLQKTVKKKGLYECFRCRKSGHMASDCPAPTFDEEEEDSDVKEGKIECKRCFSADHGTEACTVKVIRAHPTQHLAASEDADLELMEEVDLEELIAQAHNRHAPAASSMLVHPPKVAAAPAYIPPSPSPPPSLSFSQQRRNPGQRSCFLCKSTQHFVRDCPESKGPNGQVRCLFCKEEGHFQTRCPKKLQSMKKLGITPRQPAPSPQAYVAAAAAAPNTTAPAAIMGSTQQQEQMAAMMMLMQQQQQQGLNPMAMMMQLMLQQQQQQQQQQLPGGVLLPSLPLKQQQQPVPSRVAPQARGVVRPQSLSSAASTPSSGSGAAGRGRNADGTFDFSKVVCFRCKQLGHFANQCGSR